MRWSYSWSYKGCTINCESKRLCLWVYGKTKSERIGGIAFSIKERFTRAAVTKRRPKQERQGKSEERRSRMLAARVQKQTWHVMGFRETANLYLDHAIKRFPPKTYKYKKYVYKQFLKHHGDMPLIQIAPKHITSYLNIRPSSNNYNVHPKKLSSLFTNSIRYCLQSEPFTQKTSTVALHCTLFWMKK